MTSKNELETLIFIHLKLKQTSEKHGIVARGRGIGITNLIFT